VTRVDAGRGSDTVVAIIGTGRARVSCGPGRDSVIVSRFAGNRRRVTVARDCEMRRRG
jgi:hypothetical protein